MAWETQSTYFSGQGVVLIGDRDPVTGKGKNFVPVGNVSDLKISISTSVLEHKESQSGARGIDLRLTTEVKANLSMSLESFNAANMSIALRGSATTVPGGSVVDEAHEFAKGKIIALDRIGVSNLALSKGATPLVAYTAGMAEGDWDYKLNGDAGSILCATTVKTVGLVDGDDLAGDYDYAAQEVVNALTEAATEKFVRFEGLNTADENNPVVVEVFRFLTDPLKELSLLSDTVQNYALEGTILLDAVQDGSKYFRSTMLKAA